MALIHCPECGKEVSSESATCPNCGYTINKKQAQRQANLAANSGMGFGSTVFAIIVGLALYYWLG